MTLRPQLQASSHVAEVRLVVLPSSRRRGVGTGLARHALRAALGENFRKVTVDVVARDVATVQMFERLGFRPEAVLVEHIQDHDGRFQDLLTLALHAQDVEDGAVGIGLEEELG